MDTKFVFHQEDLLEILPKLIPHYRLLQVNGNLASAYESVYFDTVDLALYGAHARKKVDRFKVRYRKYIDSNLTFLEVKHKVKGRTDKRRILVDDLTRVMSEKDADFVKSTGVPEVNLVPVLVNKFERMTFVSRDFSERLTLDIHLAFKLEGEETELTNIVIAELKQGTASRISPFYALLKAKQIRPNRISKYCVGLIKMLGTDHVKYNRFKKKLQLLNKLINHAA